MMEMQRERFYVWGGKVERASKTDQCGKVDKKQQQQLPHSEEDDDFVGFFALAN